MGAENFIRNLSSVTESKRKSKRVRVLLSAKLQTPFGDIDLRLRDISRKGALVESERPLPTGSMVIFKRGPAAVPARIAWSGAGKAGLEFEYPIDESAMMVQLRKSAEPNEDRFQPHELKLSMDENVQKLARAWGVTVGINLPEEEF